MGEDITYSTASGCPINGKDVFIFFCDIFEELLPTFTCHHLCVSMLLELLVERHCVPHGIEEENAGLSRRHGSDGAAREDSPRCFLSEPHVLWLCWRSTYYVNLSLTWSLKERLTMAVVCPEQGICRRSRLRLNFLHPWFRFRCHGKSFRLILTTFDAHVMCYVLLCTFWMHVYGAIWGNFAGYSQVSELRSVWFRMMFDSTCLCWMLWECVRYYTLCYLRTAFRSFYFTVLFYRETRWIS